MDLGLELTSETPEPQDSEKLDRQTFGRSSCCEAPAQHIFVAPTDSDLPFRQQTQQEFGELFWYLVTHPALSRVFGIFHEQGAAVLVTSSTLAWHGQQASFLRLSHLPHETSPNWQHGLAWPTTNYNTIINYNRKLANNCHTSWQRLALPEQRLTACCLTRRSHGQGISVMTSEPFSLARTFVCVAACMYALKKHSCRGAFHSAMIWAKR